MTVATRPFEPKGDVAEWRLAYRAIEGLRVGDTITHAELDEALGRPFVDDRGPIYRAVRELEDEQKRTMTVVRGRGYRVVEAREHEGLARGHQKRSRRQLAKGLRKLRSVNRSKLTAEERDRFDAIETRMARVESMVRTLHKRQVVTEARTAKVEQATDDTAAQVARLEEQLRRKGLLDDERQAA